jgi:hypothetical protein
VKEPIDNGVKLVACVVVVSEHILPPVQRACEVSERLMALLPDDELAAALGYLRLAHSRLHGVAARAHDAIERQSVEQ